MVIYSIEDTKLVELPGTTFQSEGIRERDDLQKMVREQVDVISPDTMVIAEEFSNWEDSQRRIDLLCLDKDTNLVVIELKRTETGGHMELQAIRYAAMVSTMKFEEVVNAHEIYLKSLNKTNGIDSNARELILEFLDWPESDPEISSDVRIVLVSADFSKEVTASALWLNDRHLDVRCVRIRPYKFANKVLVDVQPIVPLPEAEDYQTRIREKAVLQRAVRAGNRDTSKFDLTIGKRQILRMNKNALVFELVREAVTKRQKTPIEIENAIQEATGHSRKLWTSVAGEHKSDQFVAAATEAWKNDGGKKFEYGRRFFTSDEQLIVLDGKTFAFNNGWGGEGVLQAVDAVIELMGASDIQYHLSS